MVLDSIILLPYHRLCVRKAKQEYRRVDYGLADIRTRILSLCQWELLDTSILPIITHGRIYDMVRYWYAIRKENLRARHATIKDNRWLCHCHVCLCTAGALS